MTHGSLFSGIGGFDLAAEWIGWENLFNCEWDLFCQRTLKYYWPNAKQYGNIDEVDFTVWRGRIDVLSGGFPCQPYSTAGKRQGKEDDRHKWPQMLRAIREISPRYVVGENVRGLTNWNGGLVFDEVQADLEAEGYEVLPFLLPACAVNAPHRRDRIWFIAHSNSNGQQRSSGKNEINTSEGGEYALNDVKPICNAANTGLLRQEITKEQAAGTEQCNKGDAANSNIGIGHEGGMHKTGREKAERHAGTFDSRFSRGTWQDFPTQSPVCSRNDGVPRNMDGITFSKWRNESIKGFGNAIVPQVVMQIYKAIEQYDNSLTGETK